MILPTYPRLVMSYGAPARESRIFCCGCLLNAVGPSGLAPTRPYVDLLLWSLLPRPMKEWPYDLLGPWAFREVFYPSSGPGGYLSPTFSNLCLHQRQANFSEKRVTSSFFSVFVSSGCALASWLSWHSLLHTHTLLHVEFLFVSSHVVESLLQIINEII
jgi:hypothetical protein